MRICLVAHNRFHGSPKARATYHVLTKAGHEVMVIAVDARRAEGVVTTTVPRTDPGFRSRLTDRLRLTNSKSTLPRRLAAAAAQTGADVYVPLHEKVLPVAVEAALMSGGAVQRTPRMPSAGPVDLIDLAPSNPELAMPVAGMGLEFTPRSQPETDAPAPDRHRGGNAVICYRKTATNPGRYLEAALERSGLDVRVEVDRIDLGTVDPTARFVMFVESPYPALEVTGHTDVPILFWAHHGEHHLNANLRLADRYRADAVLLAHSWHLAHWFPAPIHRFPFAIEPEFAGSSPRLADRPFDVAMVGSNLRGNAWQYQRRRQIVESLEAHLPTERTAFVEGVSPEELISVYTQARIVIDEGGLRHYPITMRVFEAIGSGAALLTDPAPGLDMIFGDDQYATLSNDVVADVEALLTDLDATQTMADRARSRALDAHTYDHRVDQLIRIAATTPKRVITESAAVSEIARLIDDDVEVQRLVHDEVEGLAEQLPDREVWARSQREGRLDAASMDAAVVVAGEATSRAEMLGTARRFLYLGADVAGIEDFLEQHNPGALIELQGSLRRVDLLSDSYRAGRKGTPR